ncbi:MAG: NAD(P)H-dependent glycerol-3-phosphate dehydrogenase [Mycoplasmatales bacterium]
MKKIVILGSGSFGCSIANVVASNNYQTYLWSFDQEEAQKLEETRENLLIKGAKIDEKIKITTDLNIVNEVDYIVYVIPSFALRQTSQNINKILTTKKNFVICTKGLEAKTMKSGYEIVNEEINLVQDIAILSGPTHAEELAFAKYTTIVATSENLAYAQSVQKIFNNSYLRVYTNTDIKGVELVGAAKNVLAIAAGICDSHPKLGDNAKAALLTRGLRELTIIGAVQDCNQSTFYGLTGLGDLIVTATSRHSRNRKFGELLGKGLTKEEAQKEVGMVVEGIYSVQALQQLSDSVKEDLPIIKSIYQVLFENLPIEDILTEVFKRDTKHEG